MRWEELFEDLASQADAMDRTERAAEIADRTRSEFGQVQLINRLRAQVARPLSLGLVDGRGLSGTLLRVGADWLLLAAPHEIVVPISALSLVHDLPRDAVSPHGVGSVISRLPLTSALRGLAQDRARVSIWLHDGGSVMGTPDRIGHDFVDVAIHSSDQAPRVATVRRRTTVASTAITAVLREPTAWA